MLPENHAPQHAAAEPAPTPAAVEPLEDTTPALAGVMVEQTTVEETEGVDIESMPGFRSLKGQLPAARFLVKAQLAELDKAIPDALRKQAEDGGEVDNAAALDAIDDIASMFQKMEDLVLDRAEDREAMTAWLCEQDNGEGALMAAFSAVSETLGN